MKKLLLFIWLLTLSWNAHGLKQSDLLPPDQAFKFSASTLGNEQVRLSWDIAKGYYLYKKRFDFNSETNGVTLDKAQAAFPKGLIKNDPNFGEMEVFYDQVNIDIPLNRLPESGQLDEFLLKAKFQGCADVGLCYPPQKKSATLELASLDTENTTEVAVTTPTTPPTTNTRTGSLLGKISGNTPLPVEQAFQFSLIAQDNKTLAARWIVTPEHHLYRSKISFKAETNDGQEVALGSPNFPKGEIVDDEYFGEMEVYGDNLDVRIPLSNNTADQVLVTTQYQGCSIATGICYPPVVQKTPLSLASLSPQNLASLPPSETNNSNTSLTDAFFSGSFLSTLAIFFVVGLGLSLTPCIFPMIPILSGVIAGQDNLSAQKAFMLSLTYVLASATAYALIGLVFGYFGENLQSSLQHPVVISLFAGLFVLLALSMFGFYELQMPGAIQSRLNEICNNQRAGSLLGAAVMGFLSTLIVGPCVAPALAAALTYIANSKDAVLGASALFSMGFGMGVILLVVGTVGGHLLPRAGTWMDTTKAIFGIMLLGMAIWMLDRIVPTSVTLFLSGTLLVSSGIYMGALDSLTEEADGWSRFGKSLGLIMLLYGSVQLIGASAGGQSILQPLKGVVVSGSGNGQTAQSHRGLEFERIKSVNDLQQVLDRANQSGQQVMLDFYADWCVDCIRLEKEVFTAEVVQNALRNVILLQADVTARDEDDRALEKHFGIIGPPTIIFFDNKGSEIEDIRMIGFEDSDKFSQRLQQFRTHTDSFSLTRN